MNLTEFQTLSKRTMPFGGEPANQVEFENMLGNYAMGVIGEYLEYVNVDWTADGSDVLEEEMEAGDTLHYCVGLLSCLGEKVDLQKIENIKFDTDDFRNSLVDILEIPKKHIYHRHELNRVDLIKAIYMLIKHFYVTRKVSVPRILQMNIDKLKTRYPEKFSVEDSIKRVDVNG